MTRRHKLCTRINCYKPRVKNWAHHQHHCPYRKGILCTEWLDPTCDLNLESYYKPW